MATAAVTRSRYNWVRRGVPKIHWAVPLAGAGWVWERLGQPDHDSGLAWLAGLFLVAWPVALMLAVFGPPAVAGAMVPRGVRKRWFLSHPRKPWPKRLQRALLRVYRRRCLFCQSRDKLQFDHYCPRSHGGMVTLFNGVVLCGYHNRVKSNYWQYRRGGKVYYTPFRDANNAPLAASILACERRARRNPLRWYYLAWILAT